VGLAIVVSHEKQAQRGLVVLPLLAECVGCPSHTLYEIANRAVEPLAMRSADFAFDGVAGDTLLANPYYRAVRKMPRKRKKSRGNRGRQNEHNKTSLSNNRLSFPQGGVGDGTHTAKQEPKPESYIHQRPEFERCKLKRTRMETAIFVLPIVGTVIGIIAFVFDVGGHRDWAIWMAFISLIAYEGSGFCWYQNRVWNDQKSDSSKNDLVRFQPPELVMRSPGRYDIEVGIENEAERELTVLGFEFRSFVTPIDKNYYQDRLSEVKKVAFQQGPLREFPKGSTVGYIVPDVLLPHDKGSLINGKSELHCFGCTIYKDSAQRIRSSSLCVIYNPDADVFHIPQQYDELNKTGATEELENLQITRRPILEIGHYGFDDRFKVGEKGLLVAQLKNAGGTKAVDIFRNTKWAKIRSEDDIERVAGNFYEQVATAQSRKELSAFGVVPWVFQTATIEEDEFRALKKGDFKLVVFARMEYSDIGGGFHWLNTCIGFDGHNVKEYDSFTESDKNKFGEGKPPVR